MQEKLILKTTWHNLKPSQALVSEGPWFPIDKCKVVPCQINLFPHFLSSPMQIWRGNHRLQLAPVLSKGKRNFCKVNKSLSTSSSVCPEGPRCQTSSKTHPVLFPRSWSPNLIEHSPTVRITFHHPPMPNSFSVWFAFPVFCSISILSWSTESCVWAAKARQKNPGAFQPEEMDYTSAQGTAQPQ